MGVNEPVDASAIKPTHRRWVGVLLSFLIAGSGIFLAGNRKAGVRWYLSLTALSLVTVALAPMPAIPGLGACVVLIAVCTVLTLWMLVLSCKPIPGLGVRGWLGFLALVVLLSALEVLITDRLARPFKVPTGSMAPTIVPGDHLFVQASAYWFSAPTRGDVVVFRTDALDSAELPRGQFHVKRIVGLPGETLQITNGRLLINGQPLQSPAVLAGHNFSILPSTFPPGGTNIYVVPAGCYFIVGDNVTNSLDSRHYGAIPRYSIIGRATKIYWPVRRAGDIR